MIWKLLGVLVLAVAAYFGYQVINTPTTEATKTSSTEAPKAAMAKVIVPELDYNAKLGETAFNNSCAACHGTDAAGQEGVAPPLVHKIYEPGHHADIAFAIAVTRGVRAHHWRFGDMPALPDVSEVEVQKITEYIRALQRANGIN